MNKIAQTLTFANLFLKFAFNFKGIARRVKHPIVVSPEGKYTKLIVVEPTDEEFRIRAGANISLNTAEMAPGFDRKDWLYKIATIWSDQPMVSMFLFGATLGFAGTLVSDTAVSPAAQKTIKTYWEKHKDNPELVTQEVLAKDTWNVGAPWLRAGYHGTTIGEAFQASFNAGKEIEQQIPIQDLSKHETTLWNYHYESNDDTKMFDPKLLRETNWLEQQGIQSPEEVMQALERGEEPDWERLIPENAPVPMQVSDHAQLQQLYEERLRTNQPQQPYDEPTNQPDKKKGPLGIFT